MKLNKFIQQLQKAKEAYIAKHGIEPTISSFDEFDGLTLCSKIVKNGSLQTHKKPYMSFKKIKAPL